PYARRLRRLAQEARKRRSGRIHTPYDEQELLATPRGTRTKFLVDRAIGSQASGITQVMSQFAPGKSQSLHRHPGEAWLYVVEGRGHSFMGTAPDQGEHLRWRKGDLIVVDHFRWHQHFTDDPKDQARPVRAHLAASALPREGATTLLEINPHAIPSDMLGESQRNILRLLQDTIPESAARRPHTVVLIDEVESFAVRRTSASFETNPVDVHRATDAVMLGIDEIAKKLPAVLFLTTTNFIDAIDDAFLSRADLVMHFALPNVETIGNILQHSLAELAVQWPALQALSADMARIQELAALCDGWNGRQVRKLVLAAL